MFGQRQRWIAPGRYHQVQRCRWVFDQLLEKVMYFIIVNKLIIIQGKYESLLDLIQLIDNIV